MLKNQDNNLDDEMGKKYDVAQKQAQKLSARAVLLRKFAERYRESSAEQLYGWEKLLNQYNAEEDKSDEN
ncbi:hypothetical protein PZB74_20030 [Porifericola rhodea]|uniref:hypothetical protein n=1 Tax=Porifericola rhodea TaxID=930972 RepID=UPI0026661C49|nr:hypothetical protein [Porifericola rhodea]WKN31243.1 hypothetical protein PZB74_20030 [Porifericola rhodea]